MVSRDPEDASQKMRSWKIQNGSSPSSTLTVSGFLLEAFTSTSAYEDSDIKCLKLEFEKEYLVAEEALTSMKT